MRSNIRVAIDGPAGAGKSSVSKMVAERLGYKYVDTGSLYRTVAAVMLRKGVKLDDEKGINTILGDFKINFKMEKGVNRIYLNGAEMTKDIRTEPVSMLASSVSAIPFVRKALFDMQRKFADEGNVVMEGRDIGTVIMPDAELKIFLTASPENRAARRLKDLEARGEKKSLEELAAEIRKRDEQDANREVAPLKPAADSILLDNSDMNLEETADYIVNIAKSRMV